MTCPSLSPAPAPPGPGWPLLIFQGRGQNPLVSQVRLERVEDVELLIRPQRQKLLNQLARVRAPRTEQEASLSRGQLPTCTLTPEFTLSGERGLRASTNS